MFSSFRRTLIPWTIAVVAVGGSVAAAAGIDDFPLSPSRPSLVDDSLTTTSSTSTTSTSTSTTSTSTTSTLPSATTVPTSVPSTTVPSTTVPSTSDTVPTTTGSATSSGVTYDVAEVGTVTVAEGDGLLHVIDATSIDGWTIYIERADAIEVEVSFKGPGRVDFKAELEDGEVRIRVRDRRTGDSGSISTTSATEVRTVTGVGGSVTAEASGDNVVLVAATPDAGWSMDVRKSGPNRVEVRFEQGDSETRIRVEVANGSILADVDERS